MQTVKQTFAPNTNDIKCFRHKIHWIVENFCSTKLVFIIFITNVGKYKRIDRLIDVNEKKLFSFFFLL